jgi:hypothetical protein
MRGLYTKKPLPGISQKRLYCHTETASSFHSLNRNERLRNCVIEAMLFYEIDEPSISNVVAWIIQMQQQHPDIPEESFTLSGYDLSMYFNSFYTLL